MSIGDKPLLRESVNSYTTTATVLLSTLFVVLLFAAAPAAAGGEDVGASEQSLAVADNESEELSLLQSGTPDREFSGGISESTVFSTDTGTIGYDANGVTVSGTSFDDGSWSGSTAVSDTVKTLNGVDIRLSSVSGVSGTYDTENGVFTLNGEFELEVVDTGATATLSVSTTTDSFSSGSGQDTATTIDTSVTISDSTISDSTEQDLGIDTSGDDFFALSSLTLDYTELGEVSGTITDDSGNAISGATVEVGGQSATTDSNGQYQITGIVAGDQDYTVSADGYVTTEGTVNVQDGGTTLDESLTALNDLSGTVTDGNGNPIEGATVDVAGAGSAETNSNGEYQVSNLQSGEYDVSVSARAHNGESTTVTVNSDTTANFDLNRKSATVEVSASGERGFVGDDIRLAGSATNVGDDAGFVTAELSLAGAVRVSKTTILGPGDSIQLSDYILGTDGNAGTFPVEIEANGQTASGTLSIEEGSSVGEATQTFSATNTGEGYVAFDESSRSSAQSNGVPFPEGGIKIEGQADDKGNWESTSVEFPTLTTPSGFDTSVATPQGLFGTIDREAGSLTSSGPLIVTILTGDEPSFQFNIEATTGESGSLQGQSNFNGDSASVLLVDNEFTVPGQTGNGLIDSALGLPLTDPGLGWLELGLNINFGEVDRTTGAVAGTVTDENGDPIGNATVTAGSSELQTGTDGTFTLEGLTTGTTELTIDAEGFAPETVEVDVTEGDTANVTAELAQGSPEFALQVGSVSASTGESFSATAQVENTGTAAGETTVSFGADGLFDVEETVEVAPGETASVTAEATAEEAGEYTAVATAAESSAEATISVTDGSSNNNSNVVSGFRATNTGEGFISFDVAADVQTAREEGLAFPESEIEIEGVLYEDGTWESTNVTFPNLVVQEGLEGSVTVPNGFTGEYDLEDDYLSSEALLQVEILAQGQSQGSFEFTVNADTGDSNGAASEEGLSGSANFEDGEPRGTVTLVDNEYLADDETESQFVNTALGLPITEPGRNWLELHLDIEPVEGVGGETTGTVAGTVTDENSEPVEGATVEVGGESATTGADGTYEVSGVATGSQTVSANADGYGETTAEVQVSDGETSQQDLSLEAGSASFEVEMSVSGAAPGETVTAEATVRNTGSAAGTEALTFTFNGEERSREVTLDPGESTTLAEEWTAQEAGEYEVGASAGGEMLAQQSVSVQEGNGETVEGDTTFVATSTGGFVGFNYESEQTAREEGVSLPEGVEIAGVINEEEGTWQSTDTFFPSFEVQQGLEVEIAAPNGITGQVDLEDDYLTQRGVLEVTVGGEATFEYEINATTGESNGPASEGGLTGSASFDQEAGTGNLTLVDNEYTIEDQTGNALVDSSLSLPSPESGMNWYELSFNVELNGTFEGGDDTQESEDSGPSVVRSVGLVGGALALAGAVIFVGVIALGRLTGGLSFGSKD